MDVLVLIGRVLFAILFLGSAYGHLAQGRAMVGYVESRGVPLAKLAVPVSGIQILLGGLMVLLGVWADLGALLLLAFLVPTAVLMHAFWKETDAQTRQMEQIQFMKDMALGGAALMLFAFFAHVGDLGLTITGPLFSLD
ncbi:MAG: DoxX family membrane protein [Haloechinothrix sp.]